MNRFDKAQPLSGITYDKETRIKPVKGKTLIKPVKPVKPPKGKPASTKKKPRKPKKKDNVPRNKDGVPIYQLTAKFVICADNTVVIL